MSLISFLVEFVKEPRRIGGIAPSSPLLARAIKKAAERHLEPGTKIIEIGAGNGAITRRLVDLKCEMLVVEPNERLGVQLRRKHPGITVISSLLQNVSPETWESYRQSPVILVSSLPFTSLPPSERDEIRAILYQLLKDSSSAALIQYTYKLWDPIRFTEPEIVATREAYIVRNLPPASVWTYRFVKGN